MTIGSILLKNPHVIPDERGLLMEIHRYDDVILQQFGQVYLTTAYPNVVKAWHYHKIHTDNFTCVHGPVKVVMYDTCTCSPDYRALIEIFVGEKNPVLISDPPVVFHGFNAIGMETAFFMSMPILSNNYAEPDEYRFPPDTDEIPYGWGLAPGLKHG